MIELIIPEIVKTPPITAKIKVQKLQTDIRQVKTYAKINLPVEMFFSMLIFYCDC